MNPNDSAPLEGAATAAHSDHVEWISPNIDLRPGIHYEHVDLWRGDHKACNHGGGTCSAKTGWVLDEDAAAVPAVTHVPTAPRARGTVTTFHPARDPLTGRSRFVGRTEEVWRAKGNCSLAESAGVKPTPEVVERLLAREKAARKANLRGEGFEAKERIVAALEAKIRAANDAPKPAKVAKPGRKT